MILATPATGSAPKADTEMRAARPRLCCLQDGAVRPCRTVYTKANNVKSLASVKTFLRNAWRVLGGHRQPASVAMHSLAPAQSQFDLLGVLNSVGRSAGMHVWDWDITANKIRFDRN